MKFIRRWIYNLKARLALKWVAEMGLCVVRMVHVSGTNYIVDRDGNHLKIGKAPGGAKRSIK
jgi:hypothetical protein